MSIFLKERWISKEKRPMITVTGSRKRTIVFGCLSLDGKQLLFKQYMINLTARRLLTT
jgi:hypothetical protein